MVKHLQALPALILAVALLGLAAAMYVPREHWPAWFQERMAEQERETGEELAPDEPDRPRTSTPQPAAGTGGRAAPVAGSGAKPTVPSRTRPETPDELMNCFFTPSPEHPTAVPRAVDVVLPEFPGRYAVWAGTGRDHLGRVWLGGCADGIPLPSARLFCYDTQTGEMADVGDVNSALREHGLLRDGERQMKIHSKIIQAADGHLYFASMDEDGENPDGTELPIWGGHLWRLRLPERKWEHLHATPQALIATAGMGRFIYALGYFDHVLIQYDTETQAVATTTVGSVGGHVSRNLLADLHGHVYVPRLAKDDAQNLRATLVEYDAALTEVGETPLDDYVGRSPAESHGITGVQPLADGSLAFVTHRGRLYHVVPGENGPAEVKDLGWMHPLGEVDIGSLFTCDGQSWLFAAARLPTHEYDWVAFDLKSGASSAHPLEFPARYAGVRQGLLLYGSMTRDVEGAFYLVGTSMQSAPYGPVVWRMMPPR